MSSLSTQLALPLEKHRNHYLFSDYYLNTLLPRQPSWCEADAEAAQALEAIHQLHADKRPLLRPTLSESALEDEWIRPILDLLDHTYHIGASLPSPEGTRTPDYALFPDEATRRIALPHLGTAEFYGTALAVADAKRWDRSLDRRLTGGAGDAFSNANPSYQIDYYLRITGRDWGLLTNGRLWRLYHRESSFRLDSYYEVDLINLLRQGQVEDFKYFYLFFRCAAFPEFLDRVLRESREYAQGVSENLKERVYEALRLLAEGFLKYPGTSLTPADLKEIHDNALILLYRLLFIFYAESRRLLPLENRSYAGLYSLKAVKEEIADRLGRRMTYLPRRATIWDNLKALFHIINEGSGELGVPAYNGRLFDPAKYPFLEEHTIGDAYLVQALDLLARAQGPQGLDFVDYRDLEIRHLGSIYEGLLEYQLRYAAQDMAVVKERQRERIVPAKEGQEVVFPASTVYPVTERGERKATGSYYTPGYIVKYIVENTLGPLVDEKQRAIQDRLTGLEAKLKAARGENRKLLERELGRVREGFGEAVLGLKMLDPAMGSGHFLVEATDYLAQRVLDFGVRLGAGAEGGEGPDETEISYWRRRAVESCIYGVDVNPLAVELAKLSLWLATAAKGKPLSFLDHHLRCGNSLIGARLADLGGLPSRKKRKRVAEEQMALFDEAAFTRDVSLAVGGLATIQELASDSVEDIHEKERIFEELLEVHLKRWRQIADLWASAYFGNEMAPEDYAGLVQWVQTGKSMLPDAQAQPYLDRAHALWREKRFFHWELEFPEVFFDQYGRRKAGSGFDAVIGNPPYLSVEQVPSEVKGYWADTFLVLQKRFDAYGLFLHLGSSDLLRQAGLLGFIVPTTFFDNLSYAKLRDFLKRKTNIRILWNLGDSVFLDAKNDVCIIILSDEHRHRDKVMVRDTSYDRDIDVSVEQGRLFYGDKDRISTKISPASLSIQSKLRALSYQLGELIQGTQGFVTGLNEAFILTPTRVARLPEPERELVKPMSFGQHIGRYHQEDPDEYVLYLTGIVDLENYPHAKQWLLPFKDRLSLRREVRRGLIPWYSLQWPRKRWHFESREAIYVQIIRNLRLTRRLIATFNVHEAYADHTLNVIRLKSEISYSPAFILALLNSNLFNWLFLHMYTDINIKLSYLRELPIRRVAFTTPQEERARLREVGITEATEFIEHTEGADPVSFSAFSASVFGRWLNVRLTAEPEQSDVVHDLLAHLAEQMITMNKEKQAETRGFLGWLADYAGLPVEDWTLKTSLKAYHQHDWAEMRRVLDRNRRKITKVNVKGREASDLIQDEWGASVEKLRPLLARIAATDRLIDLIVYRLYGLTEEEVAVVEGS